jgi:hypothetical protein
MTSASNVARVSASSRTDLCPFNRVLQRSHVNAPYPAGKDSIKRSSTTEFHKIWIDQCAATEDIRDHFGLQSALDYLISGKLFSMLRTAEQDPLFAADVPNFIAEIRRFFSAEVIRNYLIVWRRQSISLPWTLIPKWTNLMTRTKTSIGSKTR